MKFTHQFFGVVDGEIYPRVFEPGETCPPELLEAAKAVGAVAEEEAASPVEPATRKRGRKAKGEE